MEGVQIRREKVTDFILPFKDVVAVDKFTIDNGFMSVELINYGATITAIYLPNKTGYEDDIVLGFEDPLDYLRRRNPYLGATIGRYGNLISGARFSICGEIFYTSMNSPPDTYHGGIRGLDKKIWDARIEDNALVMTHKSYDLDQGFPGDVCVKAKFILTLENQLIIIYSATSNKRTPINILNECYFNLAGHATGKSQILEHELKINSNYYVVTTEDGRPTGEVDEVESTFYDLKELISVKDVIESEDEFNMEVAFAFGGEGLKNVAFLRHSESGRSLTIYSDQPCLTLKLGQDFKKIPGKEDAVYRQHSGICFQTGNLPDAIRHECFPNPILNPGEEYKHTIVWKFRVEGLTDPDEVQVEKPSDDAAEIPPESRPPSSSAVNVPTPAEPEPEQSGSEIKRTEETPQAEENVKKLESPQPIETAEKAQVNIDHQSTTENTKTTIEKQ